MRRSDPCLSTYLYIVTFTGASVLETFTRLMKQSARLQTYVGALLRQIHKCHFVKVSKSRE